jgi:hypothetical protein
VIEIEFEFAIETLFCLALLRFAWLFLALLGYILP